MKIVTFIIFSLFALTAVGDNDNYKTYRQELKEKLKVEFAPFEDDVMFQSESSSFVFTFGDMLKNFPTLPTFEAGAIVKLSENCSVVIMDVASLQRVRPEAHPENYDYTIPAATGWMLSNCDTPSAGWYINNIKGVKGAEGGFKELTKEELQKLQDKVSALRQENERCIENSDLTQTINCDRLFVVRIPDIAKVGTHRPLPELSCPKVETVLKANATECYGVEFYKKSSFLPLRMLFFINGNVVTIDDCIKQMADIIKFE